jgi:hypothetical protein
MEANAAKPANTRSTRRFSCRPAPYVPPVRELRLVAGGTKNRLTATPSHVPNAQAGVAERTIHPRMYAPRFGMSVGPSLAAANNERTIAAATNSAHPLSPQSSPVLHCPVRLHPTAPSAAPRTNPGTIPSRARKTANITTQPYEATRPNATRPRRGEAWRRRESNPRPRLHEERVYKRSPGLAFALRLPPDGPPRGLARL